MAQLKRDTESRIAFDWEVCQAMSGERFKVEAYRTTADLEQRTNPVVDVRDAHRATKYRVEFFVPTLVGPGQMAPVTVVGLDLETGSYPNSEPLTWLISQPVPYSPHFRQGAPICLGEIWREAHGEMLLGQLLVHIAKLLNWDEIARGGGYQGWNGEAIAYHKQHYGNAPLDPTMRYPTLPLYLTHGVTESTPEMLVPTNGGFEVVASGGDLVPLTGGVFEASAALGPGMDLFTPVSASAALFTPGTRSVASGNDDLFGAAIPELFQ